MDILEVEDDDGPSKPSINEKEIIRFKGEAAMIGKLKRRLLRKKLKREKLRILSELLAVNKKLKILDEMEEEDKKKD